jgi:hypothetical protein
LLKCNKPPPDIIKAHGQTVPHGHPQGLVFKKGQNGTVKSQIMNIILPFQQETA